MRFFAYAVLCLLFPMTAHHESNMQMWLARADKGQSKKGKERVVGAKRKRGDANTSICIDFESEQSSGNEAIML